jgi:hypothetical protein
MFRLFFHLFHPQLEYTLSIDFALQNRQARQAGLLLLVIGPAVPHSLNHSTHTLAVRFIHLAAKRKYGISC